MLFAQKEERSRRFALALRAGLPILLLIFLLFYALIYQEETITINPRYAILIAAITFVTVYFIYFLMNLSVEESLLDTNSQRFKKNAFLQQLKHKPMQTLALVQIKNLQELNENYKPNQIDNLFYTITKKLDFTLKQHGLGDVPIGQYHSSEFLIAVNTSTQNIEDILKKLLKEIKIIDHMEIDFKFSVIDNNENDFEKSIFQLRDMIRAQYRYNEVPEIQKSEDTKRLSDIEEVIIKSIQEKKLQLSFRPLLNTKSNQIDIYEITVKLSTDKEDILPRIFLPVLNRLGLGREYDYILAEHIISLLKLVDSHISFTFNLSPYSLRDTSFQEKIFSSIDTHKIDPSRLIIQLYERKTHHDLSGYLETLKLFKRRGLRICIDNFGSSNASIDYMKHFKFDMVQFDRDYVGKLDNQTTVAMLTSLVLMAHELHIITVAKWVDTEKQKEKLIHLGIDYLQGFGIGKPLNEQQLITYYN